MRNTAIILAAGDSNRFSNNEKKQFSEIACFPVVYHSIKTFLNFDPEIKIVLVLNENDVQLWEELYSSHKFHFPYLICLGGNERSDSVRKALRLLEKDQKIFIHDASRPCITEELLNRLSLACDERGSAVPIIESTHSLRYLSHNKYEFIDREKIVQVQTPQCFFSNDVLENYAKYYEANAKDDSQIMAASDMEINYVVGDVENIKITYSYELELASVILSKRENG